MYSQRISLRQMPWGPFSYISLGFLLLTISLSLFAKDDVEFQGSLIWQNYGTAATVNKKNTLNPENQVAKIPQTRFDSRILPNFQLRSNTFKLIFRPIVTQQWTQIKSNAPDTRKTESKLKSEAYVNEAYAQWTANSALLVAFGLQNYQWGPTESFSPTNKIFRDSVLSKDAFYEPNGKYVSRLNLSAGKHFNLVLLSEVDKTDRWEAARSEETFETTSLVKAEVNWDSGASYFGLVGGAHESGNPWFGEYFNLDLFIDGLSLFADISHERQSPGWYPVRKTIPGGPTTSYDLIQFEQIERDNDKLKTISVAGLRYAFENGSDLRFEYIENQLGYSEQQRDDAFQSIDNVKYPQQSPYVQLNGLRFAKSGLSLPGKRYFYGSLRVPDLFTIKDLLFYTRFLQAALDQSNFALVAFEYGVGDSGTIVLSSSLNSGKTNSELEGFARNMTTVGYKHAW